jgi:DNA-binding response OmpR family regulator
MLSDFNITLSKLNLLFVDDNISVSAEAHSLFSAIFNKVALAHNAVTAEQLYKSLEFDVLITDIELPGSDGLELVEKIRQQDQDFPIIVLSAHDDHEFLFRAANLRVDGYIIKPLNFNKLSPCLEKIAKRLKYKVSSFVLSEQVVFDAMLGELNVDGQLVPLGKKESDLLNLLMTADELVVSKTQIEQRIWPAGDMTEAALKNLIAALRKKLQYDLIQTLPSRGWLIKTRNDSH